MSSQISPDQFDTAGNWVCPDCKQNTGSPRGYKSHGCEVLTEQCDNCGYRKPAGRQCIQCGSHGFKVGGP